MGEKIEWEITDSEVGFLGYVDAEDEDAAREQASIYYGGKAVPEDTEITESTRDPRADRGHTYNAG
jgi:hypothetical protein